MTGRFEIPDPVRRKAAALGASGLAWLDGLPALVAELERDWSITVGPAMTGGSTAFVAPARGPDARESVLKVTIPDPEFAAQARTLAAAAGNGYVQVHASSDPRHALLLESCGPSMDRSDLAPERMMVLLCAMLRAAWRVPRPDGAVGVGRPVGPGRDKATLLAELVDRLWHGLGRPCPPRVIARALRYAASRAAAFDLDRCVVVHGDPHPGNALRVRIPRAGAETGYVFTDPDGFLAEPAYDLGVVLRDWCPQLLAGDAVTVARRYCALLARTSGIDATAIWEWGFLERVSTGLYLLELGADGQGRAFLDTAELLA